MPLSFACEKCWDSPCTCGWDYRAYSDKGICEWFEEILKYHNRELILKWLNEKAMKV